MGKCVTRSIARSGTRVRVRQPKKTAKQAQLLRNLRKLLKRGDAEDQKFVRELRKCPSAQDACRVLVRALNAGSRYNDEELLLPPPSWVHPIV
jgi:hypothetical protein